MSEQEKTAASQALDRALAALGEHFDSVQIMVTGVSDGQTDICFKGSGNYYARKGMAQDFIDRDNHQDHAARIAEAINPPDSDGG